MTEQANPENFRNLLKQAAPGSVAKIDELFNRLSPVFVPDRIEKKIRFRASSATNTITIGIEATHRLEAHAYAFASIALTTREASGALSREQREKLYIDADACLTWAVSHDLQQAFKTPDGKLRPVDSIMAGATEEVPGNILAGMDDDQRMYGRNLFWIASAFIVLHELGHLHYGHVGCEGYLSIEQEKLADSFAAECLLEGASSLRRINTLFAISIALLWLTVFTVYLGKHSGKTHPQDYDRLFQILNQVLDPSDATEYLVVWNFVAEMLHVHMHNAGIEIDWGRMEGDPRQQADYLVDLLSRD